MNNKPKEGQISVIEFEKHFEIKIWNLNNPLSMKYLLYEIKKIRGSLDFRDITIVPGYVCSIYLVSKAITLNHTG